MVAILDMVGLSEDKRKLMCREHAEEQEVQDAPKGEGAAGACAARCEELVDIKYNCMACLLPYAR